MMPARSTPNLLQQNNHHHRSSTKQNQALYSYLKNQQQQQQEINYASVNNTQSQSVITRDESPPPAPPVRDSSTLKSIKYGPGHEKFPSWPVPAAADTPQALRNPSGGGSHRSKSWTDHTNYPKEKVITYSRPYMKKQHNAYTQQKLKTVMEKCEKIPPETFESRYDKVNDRIYLPQVDHDGKPLGDMNYVVPSPPERDIAMKTQINQEDLEHYARIYHQEPMNFHLNQGRKNSLQHQHLTESGLEQFMEYNKNYEDCLFNSMNSKSDESILTHLHQKQLSYAQSEGYHSYVSSTDSTATPFLDRLRKDSHAVVRSASWDETEQDQSLRHEGRDSVVTTSSGSASSSETLKWLGSISDVSVASSSCTHLANSSTASSRQLIAHSARVQIPQRHHSESVLYISSETQDVWKDKESKNNNTNKLKLFPLNTYTVQENDLNTSATSGSNRASLQSIPSVADRISELEKQHKYSYLDPDKKHKVPDPTLKAIQKKALLSFYERHHSNTNKNSWRSEPQLAQSQPNFVVPQPPPRIKVQIPSRRASSASDYASGNNSKRSSLASRESKTTDTLTKITPKHQHSNSCGSLSTDLLGPMIVGPSISLDDWIPKGPPERPPKNPQLRNNFPPQLFHQRVPSPDLPPPSPPTVLEDEVFNCDDPLPPPPPECDQDFNAHLKEGKSQGQSAGPQVRHTKTESPIKQTIGLPENATFSSVGCRSIKTRPTEQIFHQVSSKPYNHMSPDKNKMEHTMTFPNQKNYSDTKYPITQKLVLNGLGNIAISQSITTSKQFRMEPLKSHKLNEEKRKSSEIHRRSSLVDPGDNPPPLQPRQMRVNQSMRLSNGSHDRSQPMRTSPPREIHDKSQIKSQSKASVLASRRDRDRIVPDSDTGSYKRTMSPNGHAISPEVLSESPKINTRETVWPNKTNKEILKNNNNNTSLFRRVSMNEKPNKTKNKKCDDNEDLRKNNLVLPDVLPVNAKLISNRSHYNRPSQLNFSSSLNEKSDHIRKSPMKTPPSSPSKSPSRGSPFTPLRTTNLSSTSFNNRTSPPNLISTRVTPTLTNPNLTTGANPPLKTNSCTVETSSPLTNQTPKPESPKMSPLIHKTFVNNGTNVSPPTPKRASPQIKPQLSPNTSIKISPLRLSPASSNNSSPLQTSPVVITPDNSPPASPKKSEECPQVIEGLQMIQRTEVILRVNTSTSDASSQTEKNELPPTPLPTRKKLQEEIECEQLSEDLISHLSTSDRLKDILVPGPAHKKSTDYVQGLFKPDVTARPRPLNSPFRSRCNTPNESPPSSVTIISNNTNSSSTNKSCPSPSTNTPTIESTNFATSEPKARFLTRYNSQDMNQSQVTKNTKDLNQKKEELVDRLGRKLEVLRGEQSIVDEESKYNEELGENVESHISRLARPHEAAKFRLHVEEIGKITSLLLGLSGRLARAENALAGMSEDDQEKRILESKRDKLKSQLEEAKSLKESIDRRSVSVSNILTKYLDSEEYADYDHFINMKAKLIMDSKEIADKIKLGEEQLLALRESIVT